jgi:hypothetical protein
MKVECPLCHTKLDCFYHLIGMRINCENCKDPFYLTRQNVIELGEVDSEMTYTDFQRILHLMSQSEVERLITEPVGRWSTFSHLKSIRHPVEGWMFYKTQNHWIDSSLLHTIIQKFEEPRKALFEYAKKWELQDPS